MRTLLPKQIFRWTADGYLEQLIEIIQHKATDTNEIGIFDEWHFVKIDGQPINKDYL